MKAMNFKRAWFRYILGLTVVHAPVMFLFGAWLWVSGSGLWELYAQFAVFMVAFSYLAGASVDSTWGISNAD